MEIDFMVNHNQELVNNLQLTIVDEYHKAIQWYNTWCRQVADRENKRKNKLISKGEKTRFELKIILSEKSFTIHWYEVLFVQHENKKKRIVTHVKPSLNNNSKTYYSINKFQTACEWEFDLILQLETALNPIRKRVKHLAGIYRTLSHYSSSLMTPLEYKNINNLIDHSMKKSILYYKNKM